MTDTLSIASVLIIDDFRTYLVNHPKRIGGFDDDGQKTIITFNNLTNTEQNTIRDTLLASLIKITRT